jgi:hypothetical protein
VCLDAGKRGAFGVCRRQPSASFTSAREEGDFSLPEPVNDAILAPKLTESGECRLKRVGRGFSFRGSGSCRP